MVPMSPTQPPIATTRWPGNAETAACLMVDDLTDGWIDATGRGHPVGADDWGHLCDLPHSSFAHLRDRLLRDFPEIRVTFFIPVNRVEDVRPARNPCHFQPIHHRPEFVEFLRRLDADPRFSCAYHGETHGQPGPRADLYQPEFDTYRSLDEALASLERGMEIWRRVFGTAPDGGKFPAYAEGPHGAEAVDRAKFFWWCRRWDRGSHPVGEAGAFSPRVFGRNNVIDLPSSLYGGALTRPRELSLRPREFVGALRAALRRPRRLRAQLDGLIASGDVITVQEHITWVRPDGRRQKPNLYDDERSLRAIFERLRKHRVWHATCGEIARYYEAWAHTGVRYLGEGAFEVTYSGRQQEPVLSLRVGAPSAPRDALLLHGPHGTVSAPITRRDGTEAFTTPLALAPGVYRILSSAN
jgi:hypothetical protein